MKRFLSRAGHLIRMVTGGFCAFATLVYIILAITEAELRTVMVVLAAVFGLLAILLLKGKKRRTKATVKDVEVLDTAPLVPDAPEIVEPVDAYIEANGMIYRTDGQPISDREVPYLVEMGWQYMQETLRTNRNPKFHRTPDEHEQSFRFTETHGRKSEVLTSQFETLRGAAFNSDDLDEKIMLLTDALQKYEIAKAWHYKISKGGMIYFQDMWEYMHNSQNECFSWADMTAADLQELICERDYIRPNILNRAADGFLQKDVYAQLPKANKHTVQRIIKEMEKEGAICRTKSGNTYFITLA